ncbi:MAG: 16S rRNA (cytidine(1402)-2'-O)-methyltransferase [Eubacteriales bacterium]
MRGKLILCATPIGNLEDITFRAVKTLKQVDYIAAEDTRHTKKLLKTYDINTPLTSYHEHNKYDKGKELIEFMIKGKTIALVSDAGTPGISDPGEELVRMCQEEEIEVTALPGAVAGILALIISGISTRRFCFEGFLPSNNKQRQIIIEQLKNESRTIIIYEAPHRLKKTLNYLSKELGNRNISICKELTKKFEKVIKTTFKNAIDIYEDNNPRGEYVLIIEGKSLKEIMAEEHKEWNNITIEEHMSYYKQLGKDKKEAMKCVAKDRGITKREVYKSLLNK